MASDFPSANARSSVAASWFALSVTLETAASFADGFDAVRAAGFAAAFVAAALGRRWARAALGDDIDVIPFLDDLVLAQLLAPVGDELAGSDVVLVAVPRTHEVGLGFGEVEALGRLVRHQLLFNLGDDQALAGRAALMQAGVAVGVELAVVPEDADLDIAVKHDPAVAVLEFRRLANKFLGHIRTVLPTRYRLWFVDLDRRGQSADRIGCLYYKRSNAASSRT